MRLRSLLFVPADSAKKFQKAQGCGADALILDLEDSVAATGKSAARENLTAWIDGAQGARDWAFWVRVNAFDTGLTEQDLAAVVRPGLDGVILPKCESGRDVARLAAMLDDIEQKTGVGKGNVSMIVLATETPKSMFNLATYAPAHPRLAALTWGAEDLSSAVGAIANRSLDGAWTHPYQLARSPCLMGAAAAVAGQNLGAGQPERAKAAVHAAARVAFISALGVGALFILIPTRLLGAFGLDEPIVLEIGVQLLRVLSLSGLFVAVALTYTGGLQGTGDTKSPLYISIVSQIIVPLGLCVLIQATSHLDPIDIWLAILAGHVTRCGLSVLRFNQGKWRSIKVELQAPS